MRNELKVFEYEGKSITFNLGNGDVKVNATDMARTFGKEVRQWFDNVETHAFIHALADHKGLPPQGLPTEQKRTSLNTSALADVYPSLITVIRGGVPGSVQQGTWMHEDVAIEFARWLSPKFAIWCNDRIKELMKHGATAINPESLLDPDYVIRVMTALKEERAQKELERSQKEIAQAKLREQRPDVKFANAVKNSNSDCLIGELAKLMCQNGIDIGQRRLFQWMRDNGYLMKIGRQKNHPTQKAVSAGLIKLVKKRIFLPGGKEEIVTTPFVTGKGQVYFINKFLKEEVEL